MRSFKKFNITKLSIPSYPVTLISVEVFSDVLYILLAYCTNVLLIVLSVIILE
jgi:hypothetical protein